MEIESETGMLASDELEALFDALPIDITFIDKNDAVRYFNRLGKRIFTRTKGVLGLNVRQCHPKESIEKVEQILGDFKSGKRDAAEFWIYLPKKNLQQRKTISGNEKLSWTGINAKGRLVHIRYFAVRGRNGEYLGCLEATQDITDVKKIEGEKRLL